MIVVFLAPGFEEIEALATVDILRRANLPVETVGVGGRTVEGAHGIRVMTDRDEEEELPMDRLQAIVLPGGMPGTLNLENSAAVQRALEQSGPEVYLCAICAAPSILGHKGWLEQRRATCFPSFEPELYGAQVTAKPVETDGRFITGRGAGVAIDFALEIVRVLAGEQPARDIKAALQCR